MRSWLQSLGLASKPRMDVLLTGVPRSGTSMLSNLMTSVPDTLVLYEPHLGMKRPSEHVVRQLEELGLPRFNSTRRLARHVQEHIQRWGVKEVMTRHIVATTRLYDFKTVIFVARDVRHAAMSIFDRAKEIPHRFKPGWRGQGIIETAAHLVDLYHRCESQQRVVVRYEDFVTDPQYRRKLEERLAWPLQGRLGVGLKQQGRSQELDRHQEQITAKSLELRNAEHDPEKLAFANELLAQCQEYQALFGYSPLS